MIKIKGKPFEKSAKDKDMGAKEDSKADKAMDKKQQKKKGRK